MIDTYIHGEEDKFLCENCWEKSPHKNDYDVAEAPGSCENCANWARVGQSGQCFHSSLQKGCAGCMLKESLQMLGTLCYIHEKGFSLESFYGRHFASEEQAWKAAKETFERINQIQSTNSEITKE